MAQKGKGNDILGKVGNGVGNLFKGRRKGNSRGKGRRK